jgi:hypothetical protein
MVLPDVQRTALRPTDHPFVGELVRELQAELAGLVIMMADRGISGFSSHVNQCPEKVNLQERIGALWLRVLPLPNGNMGWCPPSR